MAGVDLHAAVAGGPRLRGVGRRVVPDLALEAAEERRRRKLDGVVLGRRGGPQQQLQLADVAPPRGQQRMPRDGQRRVVPAATHVGRQLGEPGPEHGGGVQQQQVQLAPVGERPQDVEVGGGQAGQAEEAQPVGQVDEPRLLTQACARLLGPRGRMRHVGEPPSQQIPQARLPQEVRWQREAVLVDRVAFRPGGDHPRAVAGVTVEQHGQPPSDAETAGLRLRRALEVAPEGR